MPQTPIGLARKDPDKKVVDDDNGRCCGEKIIITYYDTLASDRTCTGCGRSW